VVVSRVLDDGRRAEGATHTPVAGARLLEQQPVTERKSADVGRGKDVRLRGAPARDPARSGFQHAPATVAPYGHGRFGIGHGSSAIDASPLTSPSSCGASTDPMTTPYAYTSDFPGSNMMARQRGNRSCTYARSALPRSPQLRP
jgi:hypothetical protein